MVRQYQIVADPAKMRALNITHSQLSGAVQAANKESGGALLEMGEAGIWCGQRAICARWRIFAMW